MVPPECVLTSRSCSVPLLVFLFSEATAAQGITETNPYIDVHSFFSTQVIPELLAGDSAPVITADCLKFISIFRQQLPKEYYVQLMPVLTRYLANEQMVIHTYASYAIERLLSVKDGADLRFGKAELQPHLQKLLESLFGVLDQDESKENEYAMKAIMRVCSVGQDSMVPFASVIISKITNILAYVSANPRNPKFNHSMFESIAALIKYLCKSNPALVDSFESSLFGPFQQMLSMESAAEFSPYVFQLLAQLLEMRTTISPPYVSIFPALLVPSIWSNQGNVPAVTRLLQAYLRQPTAWATFFAGNTRFNGVLGIFQELLRLRSTEGFALDLLTSIIVDLDLANTNKDILAVFNGFLFPKLQPGAKPTPKLFKHTVVLFLAFIARHRLETVVAVLDQVQKGIFTMLFDKIVLANMHFLGSELERKLGAVVAIDLLRSPAFLADPAYLAMWPRLALTAVKLSSAKPSKDVSNLATLAGQVEEDPEDILNQSEKGFSTAYAKLVFAAVPDRDYAANVTQSSKDYFKQALEPLFAQNPGKVGDDRQDKGMQGTHHHSISTHPFCSSFCFPSFSSFLQFGPLFATLSAADQQLVGSFFSSNGITMQ